MKFKKTLKITDRRSTITNCFVQAIVPSVEPTPEAIDEALAVLGMSIDTIACAYCGDRATDWDHLRPLVRNRKPTGFINEIRNLVPSCGPCNQSKSGADWRSWMTGSARNSPKSRNVQDLERRFETLNEYERWGNVEPLDLGDLAGTQDWDAYWSRLAIIEKQMREAQAHAEKIRNAIRTEWDRRRIGDVSSADAAAHLPAIED